MTPFKWICEANDGKMKKIKKHQFSHLVFLASSDIENTWRRCFFPAYQPAEVDMLAQTLLSRRQLFVSRRTSPLVSIICVLAANQALVKAGRRFSSASAEQTLLRLVRQIPRDVTDHEARAAAFKRANGLFSSVKATAGLHVWVRACNFAAPVGVAQNSAQ